MDWTRALDGYCERTDASYWSEPINALTNLAFLTVAFVMWQRSRDDSGRLLSGILFVIGIGSWLFHTHATVWAAFADTIPILGFVLVYIYLANRDFLGWPWWAAGLGALAYIPYSIAVSVPLSDVPFFAISAEYWPLPMLIALYALFLQRAQPKTALGLVVGAAILCVSLAFRSADEAVCEAIPFGTHFMWHVLNAIMLGWMIEVRHRAVRRRQAAMV